MWSPSGHRLVACPDDVKPRGVCTDAPTAGLKTRRTPGSIRLCRWMEVGTSLRLRSGQAAPARRARRPAADLIRPGYRKIRIAPSDAAGGQRWPYRNAACGTQSLVRNARIRSV